MSTTDDSSSVEAELYLAGVRRISAETSMLADGHEVPVFIMGSNPIEGTVVLEDRGDEAVDMTAIRSSEVCERQHDREKRFSGGDDNPSSVIDGYLS